MNVPLKFIDVTVGAIRNEAIDVMSFELLPRVGAELPAFTAGAHIDVHLPGLQVRSYSLLNCENEPGRYVIAVRKDTAGRGGSLYMHERLTQGGGLTISPPRNNFPLVEDASHVVFIAGGIGITPIWGMLQRLERLGRSWELHYCARTRRHAAFCDDLRLLETARPGRVRFHFDDEGPDRTINIGAIVEPARADAHLYCCGPFGMLTAFRQTTERWPPNQIHTEYFSAGAQHKAAGRFEVELAQSRRTLVVEPGKSILDVLVEAGIDVPHSCKEGVCGSCETRVIAGTPDHRDMILTADERASGRTMMICCSGSVGAKLVLDT